MKLTVTIIRVVTGLLFIFSGLVKAIDPLGLAYKMQEFFEAWASDGILPSMMHALDQYALLFSIIMITLEVVVGISLLIGWMRTWTTWVLLLLMMFFTLLTSYVLLSGKIRACGCFGDCVPLTPVQTFTKDIILLVFAIILLVLRKQLLPLFKPLPALLIILASTAAVVVVQNRALRHLPLKDCLPYKEGNNILELRKMPADAVPDVYEYMFIYEKDNLKKEFPVSALPDSSWTFVERKQVLVKKGKNNVPLINDFSLTTLSGTDSTEAILSQEKEYYLLFVKDLDDYPLTQEEDIRLLGDLQKKGKEVIIITAQTNKVAERFKKHSPLIVTCDATAIKTAARTKPAIFKMKGPVVLHKWGWADFGSVE